MEVVSLFMLFFLKKIVFNRKKKKYNKNAKFWQEIKKKKIDKKRRFDQIPDLIFFFKS